VRYKYVCYTSKITYYMLTTPFELKVGIRLTQGCQPKHEGILWDVTW